MKRRFSTKPDSRAKDFKLFYLLQSVQIVVIIHSDIQARLKTLL